MITLRPHQERGHANHGWLDTYHSFSFADYYDPAHMGFSVLRVINEDYVAPGAGFGMHPHRDMEIITVVLEGGLRHEDSLGHSEVIRPGEVQRMSAGTGVWHSEVNDSQAERVHLLQIWLLPERSGITPGYEQKRFDPAARAGRLQVVVSPEGREGSLRIHQDASLYLGSLEPGQPVSHPLAAGRRAYVQVVSGKVQLNGKALVSGDGAGIEDEDTVTLAADEPAEVLLFDLP